MTSRTKKSTASGYMTPEVNVVEILPEGVLAASGGDDMDDSTINDMLEWNGWE